jgi:hypothetical protein
VEDVHIVEKYLEVVNKLNINKKVKAIVDNKDKVAPREQIAKLRDVRKALKLAVEESLAVTETVIDDVRELTAKTATHMALRSEGAIEFSSIAIVMKKDLAESVTGDERMRGPRGIALRDQYKVMEQGLRKLFSGDSGFTEVSSKDELMGQVNDLIAKGKRVVVLDDGTLTKDLNPKDINGKAGDSYCLITSSAIEEGDSNIVPFLNINAMAMMGVGVLYDDLSLFETAYETFTGKKMGEDLIARLKYRVLWIVKALPRCIKITDQLPDLQKLKKLFEVAA